MNDWLSYLIQSNPQGVMKVLYKHGYTGYLAPQDEKELYEAAYDFIEQKKDDAVIELLKSHPLYDAISDIVREENTIPVKFKNADGSESQLLSAIKQADYKKLIETALVLVGVVYIASKVWTLITKE